MESELGEDAWGDRGPDPAAGASLDLRAGSEATLASSCKDMSA